MSWTQVNLDGLPDRSPAGSPMRWRMGRDALGGTRQIGVSLFTYEPGVRMPFGHRHREQEEVYVVVRGSGRAKLDEEIVEVATWDAIRVDPHVMRAFEAGPEGLDLICVGGRRPRGGDAEHDEGFWS